jgi:predicted esterase
VHPELGIDDILTPTGKKYVRLAETVCDEDFAAMMEGVAMGTFFTLPMASLPGFRETVVDYMGMPESGFDKPFFMGHGAADVDVPYAQTLRYATVLRANGEPVVFTTYPTDHSGTMAASLEDTIPFVRKAMR